MVPAVREFDWQRPLRLGRCSITPRVRPEIGTSTVWSAGDTPSMYAASFQALRLMLNLRYNSRFRPPRGYSAGNCDVTATTHLTSRCRRGEAVCAHFLSAIRCYSELARVLTFHNRCGMPLKILTISLDALENRSCSASPDVDVQRALQRGFRWIFYLPHAEHGAKTVIVVLAACVFIKTSPGMRGDGTCATVVIFREHPKTNDAFLTP
ncbi:hypothetical protein C2E23DRAFT_242054 [Lenzites betulinus]|nr:hypothetical protein C2E23DRAFT_242054 [Lenzites betulinus]